jgi:ferritin-like metal-binding protein YciE
MELATLQDLYIHELKDLYSAEKQLIGALPRMKSSPPVSGNIWNRQRGTPNDWKKS